MAKTKRITGTEIVKHHNNLNEYRSRYDVLEEKLLILAQSKLTGKETGSIPPITLYTSEVCKALGTRIEHMRRALKKMAFTVIEVGDIDDLEADYEAFVPITALSHKVSEKTVTLTFNDRMVPYLLEVRSQFTTFVAEHAYRLSSKYSIRIYMLTMQWWSKIDSEGEWEIIIDYQNFRDYFKLKDYQYSKTFEFKRAIIIPAINDINVSRVGLDLELVGTRKSGRTIVDYVILARKAQPDALKRTPAKTKKQLTDDDFIVKYQTEYDGIIESLMATEMLSLDLPLGVPRPNPEVIKNMIENEALAELRKRHPK